jgi:hypothetical protein
VRSYDFGRRFAAWHDRALFHFLVDEHDRDRYLAVLRQSLAPNGHAIIATFGPDGPTSCSGLPVARYSAEELAEAFSPVATSYPIASTCTRPRPAPTSSFSTRT